MKEINKGLFNMVLIVSFCFVFLLSCKEKEVRVSMQETIVPFTIDSVRQREIRDRILSLLPPDNTRNGRVSFLDGIFQDWVTRTGELPPDFDRMPSIPFLPDPQIIDEGGKNIPVKTMTQWNEKREWMKKQLEYYITGTYPPVPDNLKVEKIKEKKDGKITLRLVELSFGPGNQATLTLEIMIPPGEGPFPVFLTQWNHREWSQVAVRRGYAGLYEDGGAVEIFSPDDYNRFSDEMRGKTYEWLQGQLRYSND